MRIGEIMSRDVADRGTPRRRSEAPRI